MRYVISLLFVIFSINIALAGIYGILEGVVKDKETNEPLIGVNVLIVGTSMGAVTDVNGNYQITNVKAGTYDLQFSIIGDRKSVV